MYVWAGTDGGPLSRPNWYLLLDYCAVVWGLVGVACWNQDGHFHPKISMIMGVDNIYIKLFTTRKNIYIINITVTPG